MKNLVERAKDFATLAHQGQIRRYTNEPYIEHPRRVVQTLVMYGLLTPEVLAAAWLHDVVEDSEVSIEEIESEFGAAVAGMVGALTEPPKEELPHLNRAARKQRQQAKLSVYGSGVHNIKSADILDNVPSIVEHDPKFAGVYIPESFNMLHYLHHADVVLYGNTYRALKNADAALEAAKNTILYGEDHED